MSAYVIVDIEITDAERYAEYVKIVPATIAKYGGRYLVRGGQTTRLEGDWQAKRVVVLEFDSQEQALAWYRSEEYRHPKQVRQSASNANMVLVQGA